ncbi:MAG TPA: ABATE domain-containing protein [Gemmatimonadales bacterium]|nr:ABATE domain-containing protein [Gemmatimonadales bacterium]
MTLPELKYVGGDPALDLVNTVDWTATGPRAERLVDYDRVTRWAEGAGLLTPAAAAGLRRTARRRPQAAAAVLETAHQTRDLVHRVLAARAAGHRPEARDLARLNAQLSEALAHLEVSPARGPVAALGWRGMGKDLASPLWPVVWSAVQLWTSDKADRIRVCAGADCGWMYVDRSRNGLRRWCEMATCGTREKNRRRASGS